jgi:hypothetical protein
MGKGKGNNIMGKGSKGGFAGLPYREQLEMLAEQQSFRQLVTVAYLNRLTVLVGANRFLAYSTVKPDEDLDELLAENIIYDDREDFCIAAEDGTKFCPIITELMCDEEHGLNATCDADTKFGGKITTYRVVLPADREEDMYVVCECAGVDTHITVDNVNGGRWYAE